MSKKVTMLEVWYYEDEWYCLFDRVRKALIKQEEFEEFRKSVHRIIKIKRKRIKIN
ncbi:MAG: hypothetical protein QXN68_04000 [Thermoplasmata archaeon]